MMFVDGIRHTFQANHGVFALRCLGTMTLILRLPHHENRTQTKNEAQEATVIQGEFLHGNQYSTDH